MDIGQLVTRVAGTLNDPSYVRWTVADLVDYLNDGVLQTVIARPQANVVTRVLELTEGTRQTLPADAIALIEVQRNVPSGRVVRHVDKQTMDAAAPLWHGSTRMVDARDYAFDQRDPKTFFVYPPAHTTSKVETLLSVRPDLAGVPATPGTDPWDPFPLAPEYQEPVRLWMLHRAYANDTGAGSLAKSSSYFNQFFQWFGIDAQAKAEAEPQTGDQT